MRAVLLPALALVLTACAASPSTQAPPPNPSTSLSALRQKADAIATDSCTTRPPAQAYLDCARYVAEVGNLARSAQSAGLGSASRLAAEVGQFNSSGCVVAPGVAGPPAATCGAVLAKVQTDLKALRAELTAKVRPT